MKAGCLKEEGLWVKAGAFGKSRGMRAHAPYRREQHEQRPGWDTAERHDTWNPGSKRSPFSDWLFHQARALLRQASAFSEQRWGALLPSHRDTRGGWTVASGLNTPLYTRIQHGCRSTLKQRVDGDQVKLRQARRGSRMCSRV